MARPRKNAAKAQGTLLTPDEVVEIPVEEQPYPLPEGWKWVRLGKLYQINPRIIADDNTMSSFVPMEKIEPGMKGTFTFEILPWGKAKKGHTQFADGDVAFAKFSPCFENGKSMLVRGLKNGIGAGTTELIILRQPSVLQKYTFYIICSSDFIQKGTHTYSGTVGQQRISMDFVRNYPVPLPPVDVQQRIVDCIESLFAKLDEAREKAEAVFDGFESRKAAILHKAFTGELTEKWRKEKNISLESWDSCRLISVLKEKPRNGYSPKPVECKTNVKSMTLSATTSGFFRPEFFKYIDEEIPENSHLWLSQGDILIQRANSLEKVGTSAIYTGGDHEFIYPDLIMKLQVRAPHSYKYIAYILSTQPTLSYFRSKATGTAGNMPKINQQIVSNTPIVVPSCEEQNEIVRILDGLLAKDQQARDAAESVLERIDLMKKSILAKAFRGELTGQVHK